MRMRIRLSLFVKMMGALLLILIPLLVLYSYANHVSEQVIDQEIKAASEHKLRQFANQLDSQAELLSGISVTLLLNPSVKIYANAHEFERPYEQLHAKQTVLELLKVYNSSTIWSNQISLYARQAHDVVSTSIRTQYDDDYLQGHLVKSWQYREQPAGGIDGRSFVRYAVDAMFDSQENINLVAEISFPDANIRNMLTQYKEGGNGDPFYYHPMHDSIVNASANAELIQTLTGRLDRRALPDIGTETMTLQGRQYVVQYVRSEALGWHLVDYYPLQHLLQPIERSRNLYYTFWAVLLLVAIAAALLLYREVQLPIRRLVNGVQRVKKGYYGERIVVRSGHEFGLLVERFNEMTEQIQTLIDSVYKEQLRARDATFKQLQSQINPHFLYNCLYAIKNMAEYGDEEAAAAMAVHLGDYYRYITRVDNPIAQLREEAELLRSYLAIQQLRMKRLEAEIDIPEAMLQLEVPRLLIQPIVENAVQHGLEPKEGPCRIRITGEQRHAIWAIVVEDNGVGLTSGQLDALQRALLEKRSPAEQPAGTGMKNVHDRLVYRFGPEAGLVLARRREGLSVTLQWPVGSDSQAGPLPLSGDSRDGPLPEGGA
ncbi:sensor histidine kinase [Paenibacillus sp. IB182496]|uniref:Sensor histidine kinase n=1 Tax=Paenibacillus sabuli TaxID=2772509 RepID=A0A927GUT4_9BACL|nr:sensor histidine kinase [Paenibacillus sabuli]MBD2848042.1 sensor histidine kinase [Paenibacillus sabuli]